MLLTGAPTTVGIGVGAAYKRREKSPGFSVASVSTSTAAYGKEGTPSMSLLPFTLRSLTPWGGGAGGIGDGAGLTVYLNCCSGAVTTEGADTDVGESGVGGSVLGSLIRRCGIGRLMQSSYTDDLVGLSQQISLKIY